MSSRSVGGRRHKPLAIAVVLATMASACTGGSAPDGAASRSPVDQSAIAHRGGTLRIVMPDSPFSRIVLPDREPAILDPQLSDFPFDEGELLRCCLARTLLSHNGRSTDEGGSILHPDLAAAFPTIGSDGVSWTFRLKEGLRYGPPLQDVEIRSQDFVRAFHRLFAPGVESAYGRLIGEGIEGADAYAQGTAASISGLEAPDDHTLVIRLTEPAGDFGARLALPYFSPIPPHPDDSTAPFGTAQGHDDGYGAFLVSSGPYMLEGSERLNFTVDPADRKPVSGLVPGKSVILVRNPSWDAGGDALRPANPDRIEITFPGSLDDALGRIHSGTADLVLNVVDPPTIPEDRAAAVRAEIGPAHVHVNSFDGVRGIAMNLALPPFDDIHVRKALNLAVDKRRLIELNGGALAQDVTGHMAPNSVENNLLLDYDPYATPEYQGNVQAARAEMARSRYDSDGDGLCDAPACAGVRTITRDPFGDVARAVRKNARAIGIDLQVDLLDGDRFFEAFGDPVQKIPLTVGIGWVKGYISASSFFWEQFYGPKAIIEDNGNFTLVGATREQLDGWGYEGVEVPNLDDRIEACLPLVGAAHFECWAALDQYVMEQVVPWVPWGIDNFVAVTSARVQSYSFDQLLGIPAFDQIAVGGDESE